MNDQIFIILGYAASANACLMMLPQLYLTIQKKSFGDLSIKMICMNLFTQMLFFPYSIHFNLYPLIIVNTILSSCDAVILAYYLYYTNIHTDELTNDLLSNVFVDSNRK
jgi:uncharacterized protein with PQ loop repeat